MNPLTQVKKTQKLNLTEAALGISEGASWHSKYKDSAYIFVGGIPFDLTEGDLLAVFAQYGEVVDVNLVRDKGTGKSRGFAFLAYEDQRSTVLAVDNLNGAKLLGRIVRVDHVSNYKKKEEEEEDQDQERRKKEARGVCHAFQRGECNRGDACKFSHDEQRNANTGWGSREADSRWAPNSSGNLPKSQGRSTDFISDPSHGYNKTRRETEYKSLGKDERLSRVDEDGTYRIRSKQNRTYTRDCDHQTKDKSREIRDKESRRNTEEGDGQANGGRSIRERIETHSGIEKREKQAKHDRDERTQEDEREHKRRSRKMDTMNSS